MTFANIKYMWAMAIINVLMVYMLSVSHPYFISMTDIRHNEKAKTIEVSVRIFTDDFEKTLRKNCACKVDLSAKGDKVVMGKLISNYITQHLQLAVDGKDKRCNYKGYQQEEESIWVYFEIEQQNKMNKIEVTNTLLHDYKQEQVNMIQIHANGKDQTEKLDFPDSKLVVVY